jgi:hypothetical protein
MNMPGFTGETSLYKTSGRYRSIAGAPNASASGRGVLPQLPKGSCYYYCDLIDDPFERALCEMDCFNEGGNGGGGDGGNGGGPPCTRTCTACLPDQHSTTGFSKTCRFPNCEFYKVACLQPIGLAQSI